MSRLICCVLTKKNINLQTDDMKANIIAGLVISCGMQWIVFYPCFGLWTLAYFAALPAGEALLELYFRRTRRGQRFRLMHPASLWSATWRCRPGLKADAYTREEADLIIGAREARRRRRRETRERDRQRTREAIEWHKERLRRQQACGARHTAALSRARLALGMKD